jgi:hypothetical protein
MDSSLFARAATVQALLVGVLFAVLLALPLGDDFFDDYGWITGPVAWLACSAMTARILALPPALALFAAAAGGIAGAVVGLAIDHTAGLIVAVAVFGASCAGYDARGEQADAGT